MKGNRLPPQSRSRLGSNRLLRSWNSLNSPTPKLRIMASVVALPDLTSSTYCLRSQDGMRSGAALMSSVA